MNTALVALALLLPCAALAKDKHLPSPNLSTTARALIRQKMANHSKQMTELVWAVILLDYRESAALARAIGVEPRFARPTTGDATELNASLPPKFFELQDQMRVCAQRLETAATARDASAMAKAYGMLAETCVACHDVYMGSR